MADQSRVGGIISVALNGARMQARGNWTFSLSDTTREAVIGADGVHGYKEMPRVPFIEGEITDRGDLDLKEIANATGLTVTLELSNGKVVALRNGWAAGEWTGNTEEGNVSARFEGLSAELVRS